LEPLEQYPKDFPQTEKLIKVEKSVLAQNPNNPINREWDIHLHHLIFSIKDAIIRT
jgi:hypothetical protein